MGITVFYYKHIWGVEYPEDYRFTYDNAWYYIGEDKRPHVLFVDYYPDNPKHKLRAFEMAHERLKKRKGEQNK